MALRRVGKGRAAELIVPLEPRALSVPLGIVLSAAGLLVLGLATTERAHVKGVRGLAVVLGALILVVGLRWLWRSVTHNRRVRTQPMRLRMDHHTFFIEPARGGEPAAYEASLADFRRGLLRLVSLQPVALLGERMRDGTPIILLEYGYTPRGVTYGELKKELDLRALLARVGVTSGDEMRAAEAFMAFAAVDAPVFGIGVSRQTSELWALAEAADLAEAGDDLTVYVPAGSLAAAAGDDRVRTLHVPSLAEYALTVLA